MAMNEKTRLTVKVPEAKKESHASNKTQKPDFSQSINSPIDQIMFLQRTIGNQAVGRLLKAGVLQAKLKISQPNDVYEQEADRAAEQVMRMPENITGSGQLSAVSGQKKDESIQMKPG